MWAPRFALACFVCPPGCAAPCEATSGACSAGACGPGFRDGVGAAPCVCESRVVAVTRKLLLNTPVLPPKESAGILGFGRAAWL